MGSNRKHKTVLTLAAVALFSSSCVTSEQLQPFPNLVFYQWENRFSFGSDPKPFITSVPGENGRVEIASIKDSFYSSRGFLLYICTLVGAPNEYYLYQYDYETNESTFVTVLCPHEEPHFFALQNDYSPGFYVESEEGECLYAFFDKDNKVQSIHNGLAPIWAGDWGYATSARTPKNTITFDYREDERNTFYFYDGRILPLENEPKIVSVGQTKMLYLNGDGNLVRYYKIGSGSKKLTDATEYKLVDMDRPVASSKLYFPTAFLWRHDFESKRIIILNTNGGEFQQYGFRYPDVTDASFSRADWLVSSTRLLVSSGYSKLLIDLAEGTIEELPHKSSLLGRPIFSEIDFVFYEGDQYALIEHYHTDRSNFNYSNRAYYHVKNKRTNESFFVRNSTIPFSFQKVIEID